MNPDEPHGFDSRHRTGIIHPLPITGSDRTVAAAGPCSLQGSARGSSRTNSTFPDAPSKNKDGPVEVSLDRAVKSAITYFPAEQYHRQDELHFCVRDGNRCFLVLMITDKRLDGLSPAQTVIVQMSRIETK